ncbi:hypothetical protein A1Q1_02298 [Trichosporon asahii var. asahii CBS 2479]|uniref:SHSP domain-containing protein n=1 Tax=Trichosporon asahii var. asahii (strain ATCC 90039 / CBS 2479 / JCM 2466 / KCTC 7840 / NBRC 103889/ NCYC 2677 / UAMH 7654) TaxID=1186058 RepID=J5QR92_TRIAS|nr:hypothetical protein A1Q1_02298 [Trichosporon asahii var. asahii CBS 2479]EJT48688.1 hypothetical protein A1Q1_02298 [Trichosporon asahii var. asahii CBS 2479]
MNPPGVLVPIIRSSGTSNPTLESAQSSLDHSSSLESSLQSDSASTESGLRPVHSSTTGCYISAPMSPPVGYPMPQAGHPIASAAPLKPPVAPAIAAATEQAPERLSVISSSSSGSSRSNKSGSANVAAPGWAQPPSKTRAMSLESGLADRNTEAEPNVNPVQTVEGPSGEPIEVLKGEQGRIAIKSTPTQYEVLVWLPGFSINDITIVSRRHQVLHIVADQWDENDHAQWEIKLGDDAIMNSIRAAFTGQELRITVSRNLRQQFGNHSNTSNVSMRTASTRAAPSMSGAAIAHSHERSMSSPSTGWGALERRELEASSQSFREAAPPREIRQQ